MIIAVGFTSIAGDTPWATEFVPGVDALEAFRRTLSRLLQSWPSSFVPDEWLLAGVDADVLKDAVDFTQIADFARVLRGAGEDLPIDTTGATVCKTLTLIYGAIASDVVAYVFAFAPTVDDALAARERLALSSEDDIALTHSIAPLTDALHAAKLIAESVKQAVSSDYTPWSGAAVPAPYAKLTSALPSIAGQLHHIVSLQNDSRSSLGEELPDPKTTN
jgi:hypothetical protein